MRRVALVVLGMLGLGAGALALLLAHAHVGIRGTRPPLPDPGALRALVDDAGDDLPTGLFVVETARQAMPRSAVLDPGRDPLPDAAYVMTHPAFVLAWPDGRLFLVDLGMDAASALAFGAPLERFAGADPIVTLGSVAQRLGPAARRVQGIGFTHLHTDHTAGLASLCREQSARLPVFQSTAQHDLGNYTTRPGRAQLEAAGCARAVRLEDAPLAPVPGFPGLFVLAAAGHTPGSQVFLARLRSGDRVTLWVFTGDVVNHRDAIRHDVPKPWLYSLLVVPEDTARLAALRRLLAALGALPNVELAVSHDVAGALGASLPAWPPMLPDSVTGPARRAD